MCIRDRYYTTNGHGDVVGLLNNAGVLTKSYTYDPCGVEQNIDTNDTNPFRYCGEYFDNESKDLYLRARYYNAGTGRFTQQDPAMADGMNWYNYCGGNPVSFVDILGLEKNKVRVFEQDYEVERLEDNAEEGYTLFRFNGKVVKLYWDPAKNNATYGINSTDNTGDGYLEMERADFLNLFDTAFTYEVVEYEIGKGCLSLIHISMCIRDRIISMTVTCGCLRPTCPGAIRFIPPEPPTPSARCMDTAAYP